MLITTLLKI